MGNKLISPLTNFLKQYFNDIDENKVNLTIFDGYFKLENLHMNNNKINEELENNNIPLKIKFGMLSKLECEVSLLKAKLEYIEIENMILVVEANYKIHKKQTDKYNEEELLSRIFKNFVKYKNKMNFDPILNKIDDDEDGVLDNDKEEDVKNNKKDKIFNNNKKESPKINIFGPELTSIIQNLLDFKIKIKNIKIIYDDQKTLNVLRNDCFTKDITFGLILEDFMIVNEDYTQYMNYDTGVFKNYIKLLDFVVESGSASNTDVMLLVFYINRFSFSLCYENPFNLEIPNHFPIKEDGIKYRNKIVGEFDKYFSPSNKKLLNAFIIKELQIDFLFLFKPNNTIPLQALFIFLNLKHLNLNIEIKHIRTFTDVLAYIINILNSRPYLPVKPITKAKEEKLKNILKDEYDKYMMSELNKLIIKECFSLYNWTNLYRRILSIKKNKKVAARICKNAFEKSSLLNYLIYKNSNYGENIDFYKIQNIKKIENEIKEENEENVENNNEDDQMNVWISKIHFHVRLCFNLSVNLLKPNLVKDISFDLNNLVINLAKWSCKNKIQLKLFLKKINLFYHMEKAKKKKKDNIDIFSWDYSSKIKFKEKTKKNEEPSFEILNILNYKDWDIDIELQLENIRKENITILNCDGNFGTVDLVLSPMFLENIFNNINIFYSFHYNKLISNIKYLGISIPSFNIAEISPLFKKFQKNKVNEKNNSVKKLGNLMFSYEFKNLIDKQKKIKEIEENYEKNQKSDENKVNEDDLSNNLTILNQKLIEFEKKLQAFVLSIKLKTPIISIKLFNETMDEILKSTLNLGLLQIDMDLTFKEKCLIEAIGFKVESKYPLNSLLPFIKRIISWLESSIDIQIKEMIKFYKLKSKIYLTKTEIEYIKKYSNKQNKLKLIN